jgi:hypothetical protein
MLLWVTFALGPAVALPAVMLCVPRQWFRVATGERVLHCIACVGIFGWLLDVSGWNRRVAEPWRRFSGKRAGLPSLELTVRAGVVYHGICFAIHVLLTIPRTFQQAPVERRTMDAVAGRSLSSLPGAATTLHDAWTPASA